jgi:hypothetical protein
LLYPNDRVTELVDTIHIKLYEFLDDHGHHDQLEEKFKRKPPLRRDPPATGDGRYGPGTLYGLWPRSRWTWTRRTVSG